MMNRAISTALLFASCIASCVVAVPVDSFGINEIYKSDSSKASGDWKSNWDRSSSDTLTHAGEKDPEDARSEMKGSGTVTFGNGECKLTDSPRLYLSTSSPGWENVEFTAYGKFVEDGTLEDYSGLTMVARTNHGDYSDGCTAPGYFARIYRETGEVAFQKEYFHDNSDIIYSNSNRVDYFEGGLPLGNLIGMKFVVYTLSDGSVKLELYLDLEEGESGGNWRLVHSMTDSKGSWTTSKSIPSSCSVQSGDPVLGAKKYCYLRSDGKDSNTEVVWSKASIRNILPEKNSDSGPSPDSGPPPDSGPSPVPPTPVGWCQSGTIFTNSNGSFCCGGQSECQGKCGQSGCGSVPGGAAKCCTSHMTATCSVATETGCKIPNSDSGPSPVPPTPVGWCQSGTIFTNSNGSFCCGSQSECQGKCGQSGCGSVPGGADKCCTSSMTATCSVATETGCKIPE